MFDYFDDIVAADPADLPATALAPFVVAAHGARERFQLALVLGVGEVDATFEYRAAGFASAAAWLRAQVHIREGDALRVVALARNLRRADLFDAAVSSGELPLARAEALLRPLANHRVRAAYLENQAAILEQSAGVATRDLGRLTATTSSSTPGPGTSTTTATATSPGRIEEPAAPNTDNPTSTGSSTPPDGADRRRGAARPHPVTRRTPTNLRRHRGDAARVDALTLPDTLCPGVSNDADQRSPRARRRATAAPVHSEARTQRTPNRRHVLSGL